MTVCFWLFNCHDSDLTHWGRVTHLCVSEPTIINTDNGLSPGRRQTNIWTNTEKLLIRTPGTNFSEILSEIHIFSFKKMHLKMSSARWRPFCLRLNVLKKEQITLYAHILKRDTWWHLCFCDGVHGMFVAVKQSQTDSHQSLVGKPPQNSDRKISQIIVATRLGFQIGTKF